MRDIARVSLGRPPRVSPRIIIAVRGPYVSNANEDFLLYSFGLYQVAGRIIRVVPLIIDGIGLRWSDELFNDISFSS